MNEKPKSKWYWRLLRWGMTGFAIIITLAAIVVTEENWRGKREWENYKREEAAKGEQLDQVPFSTNKIPDEQNFVKAPIFSWLAAMKWDEKEQDWKPGDTNTVDRIKMQTTRSDNWHSDKSSGLKTLNAIRAITPAPGDWRSAKLTDLKSWQNYYRTPLTNAELK